MQLMKPAAAAAALIASLAGCNTTQPMIPDKVLNVSPSVQIPFEAMATAIVVGAAAWYVMDPLAPTWGIQQQKIGEDRYRIDLRQKRFAIGGDGEAQQVFNRAAEKLAEENGYPGYTIISYNEGIESGMPVGQRVSRGVVVLTRAAGSQVAY